MLDPVAMRLMGNDYSFSLVLPRPHETTGASQWVQTILVTVCRWREGGEGEEEACRSNHNVWEGEEEEEHHYHSSVRFHSTGMIAHGTH